MQHSTDTITNGYGDLRIPEPQIETITKAEVRLVDTGIRLYVRTDRFRAISLDIEHNDCAIQKTAQDAFNMLARACEMGEVNDAEELIGKKIQWRWSAREIVEWYTRKIPRTPRRDVEPPPHPRTIEIAPPAPQGVGRYVYVISCVDGERNLCKIGIANSAEKRVRTLSTSSPHTLRLEMARYCECARTIESEAHAKFADRRLNGEWFEMSPQEAIAYVNHSIDRKSA